MNPEKRNDAISADIMAKLPKKATKTIVGHVQKTERDKETGEYVTKLYNFYDDNTEECLDSTGKKVAW